VTTSKLLTIDFLIGGLKMKVKKIATGYYVYTMETLIDGRPNQMKVEISKGEDELKNVWIQKITVKSEIMGEHFATKRQALESAIECAKLGWHYYEGLGWCLNT
jgi:hypothetical protein